MPSIALLIPTHLEAAGATTGMADHFLVSGPGKVNAAVAATRACLEMKADILMVWGLAGGLAQGMQRGDFVVADTLYQHDFNIAPLMDCAGPGDVPGLPAPHWPCAQTLADLAESAIESSAPTARVWRGPVATGDQFVSGQSVPMPGAMHHAPPLAVDMESAALWQALHRLGQEGFTPPKLVVVRVISDSACEAAAGDFTGFLRQFETHTRTLLPAILHSLKHTPHA
jgi:adenosylhomocysteine nucleosidase